MKRAMFMVGVLSASLMLGGCEQMALSDPKNGFNTDYAMSALEYSLFTNKELTVVENELLTRISMAKEIKPGSYKRTEESENTLESIDKVQDILDELTVTRPAVNYESDRESTIRLVKNALDALNMYNEALLSGGDVSDSAASMQACFIAITGEANVYYE